MVPEGWKLAELSKVVQQGRKISYGIVQPGEHDPDGVFLIRGQDYSRGWAQPEKFFRVSPEIDRPYRRSKVRPGDIVMTIVGANTGATAVVPEFLDGANITQTTARIAVDPEVADPTYVINFLSGYDGQREVYRFVKGGAQPGLNIGDVERFLVALPPLREQQKIAEILGTWDMAIQTTEALLVNARTQKRALMQSLLTGTRRFPGFEDHPWREVRIGTVATEVSVRNAGGGQLPVISCTKATGFVNSLGYFKKQVFSDDLSGYKVVTRGQIAYPSNHVEEGSIGLQDLYDRAIVSPIYTVFQPGPKIDPKFMFRVLKSDRHRQLFASATSASVDRRGSLRWKAFSLLPVPLPTLDEQRAINEALDVADDLVNSHEQDLERLRSEKRSLMQELLTGRRRVM